MMRNLVIFIAVVFIYYAVKTVVVSAMKSYHEKDRGPARIKGEEMVLDPECRTYVVKDRAINRRVRGKVHSFCSEACAQRYEERNVR